MSKPAVVVPLEIEEARPMPPSRLDKEEADEWRAIVERMPAGRFSRENLSVLEALVCQICSLRLIEQQVRKMKKLDLSIKENRTELHQAIQTQERANKTVGFLSTKLRLTQQSNYD